MSAYESTTSRFQPEPSSSPQPSQCVLFEDLLPLYAEGEVSPGTRDLIVEHLAQCEHCAGFLAGAQSVRAQLRQDQQSRHRVVAADQQASGTMHALQFLAVVGAVLAVGMGGFFFLAVVNAYGMYGASSLLVLLLAATAGAYALWMLLAEWRRASPLNRLIQFGIAALGGVVLLVFGLQIGFPERLLERLLPYTQVSFLYRVVEVFGPLIVLGMVGVMLVLFSKFAPRLFNQGNHATDE